MANQFYIGNLNPIKFYRAEEILSDHYFSKFMDDYDFKETLNDFESDFDFAQEWIKKDIVKLQIRSNYGPVYLQLHTIDDIFITEVQFIDKQQDFFNPGLYIRQVEFNLNLIPEGCYKFKIKAGGEIVAYSNKQVIVEKPSRPSLLLGYKGPTKYEGIYFGVPFTPTIRIPGILVYKEPGSKDVIYLDQSHNPTLLKSVNYRVFTLIIAGETGMPPYMIDKIGRMLGCIEMTLDGREFTKPVDSGTWSKEEKDNVPLKGWSHDLIERINNDSIKFENNVQVNATNNMIAVLENKGFGMEDNTGSEFAEFLDVD